MITLWGRNNSTNVKKVLLTLEELELPYEQILAGREFGINHDADFLAMNPNGLVPLLRDDESDLILWESNAIVRYLAAQYGQKRLWIDSPARRAEAEKWMDWANQTLSNAHRGILMGLVRTPPEERDQAAIDASCKECDALFALLDAELAKVKWFSGDEFGVGDIAFYSAAGVHVSKGATCFNLEELPVKHWAMSMAQKHVLVVDHSKFGKVRPARMGDLKRFDIVVSDCCPEDEYVKYAQTQRIKLMY